MFGRKDFAAISAFNTVLFSLDILRTASYANTDILSCLFYSKEIQKFRIMIA
ncbi:MAG: hypothetical protein ACREAD_06205 [Nitrosopumilaceae archaeon]